MKKSVLLPALSALCIVATVTAAEKNEAQAPAPAAPAKQEAAAPAPAPAADAKKLAPAPAAADAKKDAPAAAPADQWAFVPDVVAEIGDKKITKAEFLKAIQEQLQVSALPEMPAEQMKMIVRQMVQGMVDKMILIKLAEKDGFKPGPEIVASEFDKMLKTLPSEQLDEFKKQLEVQQMNLESYKEKLTKDVNAQEGFAINAWVEKNIVSKIEVTDADVEKFYRENQERFKTPETIKASHILIRPKLKKDAAAEAAAKKEKDAAKPEDKAAEKKEGDAAKADVKTQEDAGYDTPEEADKAARKKAEEILAKLKQGQDFGALAEKESECPSGKSAKGSLGEFGRDGSMVKEFEDAAFALKPGEMSDIVKTQFGYHIIKVEEKKEAGYVPLDKVKDFVKGQLKDRKMREAIQKLLEEEKTKLNVKMNI